MEEIILQSREEVMVIQCYGVGLYTLWRRLFTGDFSVNPSPLDVARKDLRKLLQVNNGICFNAPIT